MFSWSLISPLDQPLNRQRLLAELRNGLKDAKYSSLRIVVAFAKVGPLLRLEEDLAAFRSAGGTVETVFGVDQQGTSAEALRFALENFDSVYVTRERNLTFHPKLYAFAGPHHARLFVGSNNLTVGGTETNFEAAARLDFDLSKSADAFHPFEACWAELLPGQCKATLKFDEDVLGALVAEGTVVDEAAMRKNSGDEAGSSGRPKAPKSGMAVKPPSALPAKRPATKAIATPAATQPTSPAKGERFAIQIRPHHNGEIFLSVTAALQNPSFFKWPFNGTTSPKKGSNTAYPQLDPDPVVNITVYGADASPKLILTRYELNTVYYEKKSEIRITASPLVEVVPDYSVMVMTKGDGDGIDYSIDIYRPDSPDYAAWVAACNQSMPGGGKEPRKFGWF